MTLPLLTNKLPTWGELTHKGEPPRIVVVIGSLSIAGYHNYHQKLP